MKKEKKKYVPEAGDIVWIDLDPTKGHEQRGRRPVLVVSPKSYNQGGLMAACPMTTHIKQNPFEVLMSNSDENSVALANHVRTLDWRERGVELIGHATDDELDQTRDLIAAVLGL